MKTVTTVCQIHEGRFKPNGYGYVEAGGVRIYAHRLAWALHNGSDPADRVVRHLCHNPGCVNPEHLTIGSHKDNSGDMVAAGRSARGGKQGLNKLTESQVTEIRSAPTGYRTGVTLAHAVPFHSHVSPNVLVALMPPTRTVRPRAAS